MMTHVNTVHMEGLSDDQIEAARARRGKERCGAAHAVSQRIFLAFSTPLVFVLLTSLISPPLGFTSCRANHRVTLEDIELPDNHPWATKTKVVAREGVHGMYCAHVVLKYPNLAGAARHQHPYDCRAFGCWNGFGEWYDTNDQIE